MSERRFIELDVYPPIAYTQAELEVQFSAKPPDPRPEPILLVPDGPPRVHDCKCDRDLFYDNDKDGLWKCVDGCTPIDRRIKIEALQHYRRVPFPFTANEIARFEDATGCERLGDLAAAMKPD